MFRALVELHSRPLLTADQASQALASYQQIEAALRASQALTKGPGDE